MTNAIARWHSQAPAARSSLEQAYADRLEGEMQEMAIQLNQVCVHVDVCVFVYMCTSMCVYMCACVCVCLCVCVCVLKISIYKSLSLIHI